MKKRTREQMLIGEKKWKITALICAIAVILLVGITLSMSNDVKQKCHYTIERIELNNTLYKCEMPKNPYEAYEYKCTMNASIPNHYYLLYNK